MSAQATQAHALRLAQGAVGAIEAVAERWVVFAERGKGDGFSEDLALQIVAKFARAGGVDDLAKATGRVVAISDRRAIAGNAASERSIQEVVLVGGAGAFSRPATALKLTGFSVLVARTLAIGVFFAQQRAAGFVVMPAGRRGGGGGKGGVACGGSLESFHGHEFAVVVVAVGEGMGALAPNPSLLPSRV